MNRYCPNCSGCSHGSQQLAIQNGGHFGQYVENDGDELAVQPAVQAGFNALVAMFNNPFKETYSATRTRTVLVKTPNGKIPVRYIERVEF